MKSTIISVILTCIAFLGCEDSEPSLKFKPTDVIVIIKDEYSTEMVFELINDYDNEVEIIRGTMYTSALPVDSLKFVINYLKDKSYTHNGPELSGAIENSYTGLITVYPKLYQMRDVKKQEDWLKSMQSLKCSEVAASKTLLIHVPAGTEKEWIEKYKKNVIVETAELNMMYNVNL